MNHIVRVFLFLFLFYVGATFVFAVAFVNEGAGITEFCNEFPVIFLFIKYVIKDWFES